MTPQSAKLFSNNYIMRAVIKEGKILIGKIQIVIDRTIYMQKLKRMYSHMKNLNAVILLDLKRLYIRPG